MKARMPLRVLSLRVLVLAALILPASAFSQDVEDVAAVKRKRLKDDAADFWIYDDVAKGYARAKETGQPLLVSFRCVP